MAIKPNTRLVFEYLRKVAGENVTSADVAEALGLDDAAVFKNADEGDLTIINSSVASKNVGDPRWIVAE